MLAKEPRFLHRFYGSSSEMMHGNKDDQFPAVGQSKIREKIKSLNFKDCHTKVCHYQIFVILIGRRWCNITFRLHNWTPSWQSEMESVFKSRARFQIIKNPFDDLCRLLYLDHKSEMVSHHKVNHKPWESWDLSPGNPYYKRSQSF